MTGQASDFDIHTFDIWDQDRCQAIFEIFSEMNRSGPVTWTESHGGHWVITGYEAVREASQDWRTFTSTQGVQVPPVGTDYNPPITEDPPRQVAFRQPLAPHFSPKAAEAAMPRIREYVDDLIDSFVESGACDFAEDFTEPLVPLVFFTEVLHVPEYLLDSFMERFVHPGSTPRDHTAIVPQISRELVEARRSEPPLGDVIDAIFAMTVDGEPLGEDDVLAVIEILLLGGTDTTRNVITSSLHFLAQHPDLRHTLASDPSLMPAAVEELLRLFGSVQTIGRTATCAVRVGTEGIPEGGKVVCALAAANRDPAEFRQPDEFFLDRPANRHFAFGVGPHRCIGSNLARAEILVALQRVLQRIPDYELAAGWRYRRRQGFIHGPETLRVTFPPGKRSR